MTGSGSPSSSPTENSRPFIYCSIIIYSTYLRASSRLSASSSAVCGIKTPLLQPEIYIEQQGAMPYLP
jgi:hypothetical protein